MKLENNSTETYLEIWTAIEGEVKALNHAKRRKRKSRLVLFILLPFLVFGTLWFTDSNWDSKATALENIASPTKLKEVINPKKIIESQEDNFSKTIISNIPNQVHLSKKLTPVQNSKQVNKINQARNRKKVVNNLVKTNKKSNSFVTHKELHNQLNLPKKSVIKSANLLDKETFNTTILNKLPLLPITFLETKSNSLLPIKKMNLNNEFNPMVAPISEKKWIGNFISVSSGLSYVHRKLAVKEENLTDLIQYRNATERVLYATHYGLTYTLQHRSKIKFISGINFTSITEAYNLSQTKVDTIFVPGLEKIITYLDGTRKEVYGNASIKRTTQSTFEYFHKYSLIEVPLLLGFDKQWGDFKLGYQAGVLTNISLRNRGKRVDIAGAKQEISQLGYSSKIGLGFYAGLSLQKPILPNVTLSIIPSMRIYPDISKNSNLISQKYKLYGINVNLAYKL